MIVDNSTLLSQKMSVLWWVEANNMYKDTILEYAKDFYKQVSEKQKDNAKDSKETNKKQIS